MTVLHEEFDYSDDSYDVDYVSLHGEDEETQHTSNPWDCLCDDCKIEIENDETHYVNLIYTPKPETDIDSIKKELSYLIECFPYSLNKLLNLRRMFSLLNDNHWFLPSRPNMLSVSISTLIELRDAQINYSICRTLLAEYFLDIFIQIN